MVIENKRTAIMNKLQQAQNEISNLRMYSSAITFAAVLLAVLSMVMAFELLSMYDAIEGIC